MPAKPVFEPRKYIKMIRKAMSHFRAESEEDDALNERTILSHDQLN